MLMHEWMSDDRVCRNGLWPCRLGRCPCLKAACIASVDGNGMMHTLLLTGLLQVMNGDG